MAEPLTETRLQEIEAHLVDPAAKSTMGERYTMIWELVIEVRRLRAQLAEAQKERAELIAVMARD